MTVQVVVENPDYEILAVDPSGMTYGLSVSSDNGIWRSDDHGSTWAQVLALPSNQHVKNISALASGTLLAHVDTGEMTVFRSSDQGDTWTPVLALQPGSPIFYTTLTSHSITEGGGFIWLGTYNTGQSPPYPNYIYRSADDGATWSIVNTTTTHRHIHGLRYNGGKLYVFFGDSSGDGIWVSSDNGATLQPLCTDYACVTIDAAFDPANTFMLFGNDNYVSQNRIVKVALSDGTLTPIMDIPYDSFSTLRLGASTYLVGTTHESGVPIVDPDLHLFASVDGGDSFQDVFQRPIAFPDGRSDLRVQFSYPNGDFPIQVAGYGTIVGRLVPNGTPTVPVNTGLPTVTGTAQVGQTLTGTVGSWTGATSFAQQWQRCSGTTCNPIANATNLTYVPIAADVGFSLRLQVTATNTAGPSQPANSAQTAAVVAAGSGGGTVTDSFTRADALTLGTGWSTTTRVGGSSCLLAISSNQAAYPSGKSGGCDQYWTADNLADAVGSFTVTALPPDGGEIDVEGRIQNGGTSQAVLYEGAWLRHTAGPDTFYIVRRSSNGSWTTIATINGPDIAVGDQLAFKLAGTSLSLHRKPAGSSSWTQILAATDTTISGPGRLGLEFYNASGAKADDWTISPDLPGGTPSVPVNTGLPTVSGTAQVGQTLTGTVGSWTGATSFAQQWQRCSGTTCNPIANATDLTYVPIAADVGFSLRLQVTASNTAGPSQPANSAQTAAVTAATGTVPVNTGLPTVSGTAQVGQTLTGTVGSWTGASSYGQQWQRCTGATCNPIGNATSLTYRAGHG